MKILIADGINYGIVDKFFEDNEKYIFKASNKEIAFPKIKYKLEETDTKYIMNFIWMPSNK